MSNQDRASGFDCSQAEVNIKKLNVYFLLRNNRNGIQFKCVTLLHWLLSTQGKIGQTIKPATDIPRRTDIYTKSRKGKILLLWNELQWQDNRNRNMKRQEEYEIIYFWTCIVHSVVFSLACCKILCLHYAPVMFDLYNDTAIWKLY